MIYLILDSGMETERSMMLDHISERPLSRTLVGAYTKEIKSSDDFPDISAFTDKDEFTTVRVTDEDGIDIPIFMGYSVIRDVVSNYDSVNKYYSLSITLGCSEPV